MASTGDITLTGHQVQQNGVALASTSVDTRGTIHLLNSAELYGLRVTKRILIAFVACGALTGLAGVLYAARYGTINSQAGSGFELDAVGAAVIGGVAIFGGSGTVWGAALGAALLLTINRALPILGVPDFWQRAVVGVLIIGAIVLDRVLALRQSRKLLEERDDSNV